MSNRRSLLPSGRRVRPQAAHPATPPPPPPPDAPRGAAIPDLRHSPDLMKFYHLETPAWESSLSPIPPPPTSPLFLLTQDPNPHRSSDSLITFPVFFKKVSRLLAPKLRTNFIRLLRGGSFPNCRKLADTTAAP